MTAGIEHWYRWSSPEDGPEGPKLDFLPARARRRLGMLTRCVLEVGHNLCDKADINDVVYASRYGELGRQLEITRGLLDEDEVSPSTFSYSVFNTPVALLSLHEGIRGRTRAVFGGIDAFSRGLMQCLLALNNSTMERILFLFGDELIPEVYGETGVERGRTEVIGLILNRTADEGAMTVELLPESGIRLDSGDSGKTPEEDLPEWLGNEDKIVEFPAAGYSLLFRKGGAC